MCLLFISIRLAVAVAEQSRASVREDCSRTKNQNDRRRLTDALSGWWSACWIGKRYMHFRQLLPLIFARLITRQLRAYAVNVCQRWESWKLETHRLTAKRTMHWYDEPHHTDMTWTDYKYFVFPKWNIIISNAGCWECGRTLETLVRRLFGRHCSCCWCRRAGNTTCELSETLKNVFRFGTCSLVACSLLPLHASMAHPNVCSVGIQHIFGRELYNRNL